MPKQAQTNHGSAAWRRYRGEQTLKQFDNLQALGYFRPDVRLVADNLLSRALFAVEHKSTSIDVDFLHLGPDMGNPVLWAILLCKQANRRDPLGGLYDWKVRSQTAQYAWTTKEMKARIEDHTDRGTKWLVEKGDSDRATLGGPSMACHADGYTSRRYRHRRQALHYNLGKAKDLRKKAEKLDELLEVTQGGGLCDEVVIDAELGLHPWAKMDMPADFWNDDPSPSPSLVGEGSAESRSLDKLPEGPGPWEQGAAEEEEDPANEGPRAHQPEEEDEDEDEWDDVVLVPPEVTEAEYAAEVEEEVDEEVKAQMEDEAMHHAIMNAFEEVEEEERAEEAAERAEERAAARRKMLRDAIKQRKLANETFKQRMARQKKARDKKEKAEQREAERLERERKKTMKLREKTEKAEAQAEKKLERDAKAQRLEAGRAGRQQQKAEAEAWGIAKKHAIIVWANQIIKANVKEDHKQSDEYRDARMLAITYGGSNATFACVTMKLSGAGEHRVNRGTASASGQRRFYAAERDAQRRVTEVSSRFEAAPPPKRKKKACVDIDDIDPALLARWGQA